MMIGDDEFKNPNNVKVKLVRTPIFLGDEIEIRGKISKAANWAIWIMAISMINTILIAFGSDRYLNFGLSVTFCIDMISNEIIKRATDNGFVIFIRIINIILDCAVYSTIMALWYLCVKKLYKSALVITAVLFIVDGCVFALFGEFVPLIIHVVAVVYMYPGISAFNCVKIEKRTQMT